MQELDYFFLFFFVLDIFETSIILTYVSKGFLTIETITKAFYAKLLLIISVTSFIEFLVLVIIPPDIFFILDQIIAIIIFLIVIFLSRLFLIERTQYKSESWKKNIWFSFSLTLLILIQTAIFYFYRIPTTLAFLEQFWH